MNADRDYFGGCHNVPMFATYDDQAAANQAETGEGWRASESPTLADVVRDIDRRRIVDQLELPAELMPKPDGQLFA